jgi:hypothetical protein
MLFPPETKKKDFAAAIVCCDSAWHVSTKVDAVKHERRDPFRNRAARGF